jgi:hypothetical protein
VYFGVSPQVAVANVTVAITAKKRAKARIFEKLEQLIVK